MLYQLSKKHMGSQQINKDNSIPIIYARSLDSSDVGIHVNPFLLKRLVLQSNETSTVSYQGVK